MKLEIHLELLKESRKMIEIYEQLFIGEIVFNGGGGLKLT